MLALLLVALVVGNVTAGEQGMIDATDRLAYQTQILVIATIISGVLVAGTTGAIALREFILRREIEQTKHMQEIMSMLSLSPMVEYKGTVYEWYCRLKKRQQPVLFNESAALRKAANEVERTFDIVAVMVLKNMVKYEWFFHTYHYMALKVWKACEEDNNKQVEMNPHAAENFRALVQKIRERTDVDPNIDCDKVDPT